MIKIETASLEDFNEIFNLILKLDEIHILNRPKEFKKLPYEKRYKLIFREFKENKITISVARNLEKKIIGVCIGKILEFKNDLYIHDSKIGKILYIYVNKYYREKSVASKLLKNLEKIFIMNDVNKIEFQVYSFNDKCINKPLSQGYNEKLVVYEKELK